MRDPEFTVRAFGQIQVEGPIGPVHLGGPRPRTVLALLVTHAGRAVSTDRLVDETWGESPPSGARRTLQSYVASLRKALGGDSGPLQSVGGGYLLDAERLEVDLFRFEKLVYEGREHLASGDPTRASRVLERALDLWVDAPFADLPADDVPTLQLERRRLSELRLNAVEARIDADLSLARYRQLVPELETLVADHPEREGLWAQLLVALHESGRSAEALRAADRLRRYMATELGLEPGDDVRRLEYRIAAGERLITDSVEQTVCPYKGLAAFQPADAGFFFGRGELLNRLVGRLAERRLVAVVGASGAGKSSLVAAGLVPALKAGALPGPAWEVTITKPGEHPLETVDLRGGVDDERRLVVIDQFEEVFTLCTDAEERHAFFTELVDSVEDPKRAVYVTVVARADFYGLFAAHSRLSALVSEGTLLVGPMSPAELEKAVTGPAERVGLTVESRLLDAIREDAAGEPAILPLVSHALVETWARRDGKTLTLAGYLEAGRVAGALTQTAETTLRHWLDIEQQAAARDLLLRLVEPGEDGRDTRRTVVRDELLDGAGTESTSSPVLDALVGARLLTVDDEGVSLTHEALIRQWPTLRRWLDEERQGLVVRRQLTEAAQRWDADGRDPNDLLGGARLAAAIEWRASTDLPLAHLESEFLDTSMAMADRQRRQAEETVRQQRQANRRLRVLVGATLLALVISAVLGVVALRARDRAETQAEAAIARQLARDIDSLRATDLDLALLVAAEAVGFADRAETRAALLSTLSQEPHLRRLVPTVPRPWFGPAISADGSKLIASDEDRSKVAVLSLADGQPVGEPVAIPSLEPPLGGPSLAMSPDGSTAAVQLGNGTVWLLEGETGQRIGSPLKHGIAEGVLAFDPDGRILAVASVTDPPNAFTDLAAVPEASVVFFEVASGQRSGFPLQMPGSFPLGVAFSPDGTMVAAVDTASQVWVWDRRTGEQLSSFLGPTGPANLVFDFTGELLAVVGERNTRVFQARTGQLVAGPLTHEPIGSAVAFSPDGRLVTGASDGWRIWDLTRGGQQEPSITSGGSVDAVQITSDGVVVTANNEGRVIEWSLETLPPIGSRLAVTFSGVFAPDATTVISTDLSEPTRPYLYDFETRREIWRVGLGEFSAFVDRFGWAPDGDRVAATTRDGELVILRAVDGTAELGPLDLQSMGLGDFSTGPGDPAETRVQTVRFSPNGTLVGVATTSGRLVVVDAFDGGVIVGPVDVGIGVGDVVFDTEDRLLIGGQDGVVYSFDVESGDMAELLRTDEPYAIQLLDLHPGEQLTVAGDDGLVEIWDLSNLSQAAHFDAGTAAVSGVAISPDGRWLAASLETGQTQLFEVSTALPAGTLGEQNSVLVWPHPIAFNANGDRLYTWDNESYVEWVFDLADWQAAACLLAGRPMSEAERSRFVVGLETGLVCPR